MAKNRTWEGYPDEGGTWKAYENLGGIAEGSLQDFYKDTLH